MCDTDTGPFRRERRRKRDLQDTQRSAVRDVVEPVPDVVCTQCPTTKVMTYEREYSVPRPHADTPLIEATWECPDCTRLAFGYVTEDGLTSILDNAKPSDSTSE